jgi:SAM-dependent methyltransferase
VSYDPAALSAQFDEAGEREWNRLVATPVDEISLHLHSHYLRGFVPPGARVLEIGAGAGRFTQALAELGARVLVADLSAGQLALNRRFAAQYGFAAAVEDWRQLDITDLSVLPDGAFECVVAYGGPFSYVLDRRDAALRECMRVLGQGGRLLASVMSLWGSAHRDLAGTLDVPPEYNRVITTTGDLTTAAWPARTRNQMHLFRAGEVRDWLLAHGLRPLALSASGVLANGYAGDLAPIRADPARWNELLRMELEASADPACLGLGTHLIFMAAKTA